MFAVSVFRFSELGFCLGQFRLPIGQPIQMLGWSTMVGAPGFHGVLALHDLSGQSFDLFEKILLRPVHAHHHNMDASF